MTDSKQTPLQVALIGNPNCGKTTLFNQLTGGRQRVGNWPGVTVTQHRGMFTHDRKMVEVIDLPGVYALHVPSQSSALDERIACEFILQRQADIVVNILDATNLKRNLYLTLQLLEMQVPMIVALNMSDLAQQQQIQIDHKALSRLLGCPVIPLVSVNGEGLQTLKQTLISHPRQAPVAAAIPFPAAVEHAIGTVMRAIKDACPKPHFNLRWLATRHLEKDALACEHVSDTLVLNTVAQQAQLIQASEQETSDIVIAESRYRWIAEILQRCVVHQAPSVRPLSHRLDDWLLHRWLGIPIFLFVMYLLFELSMNIGNLVQPLFDITSKTLFVDAPTHYLHAWHLPAWLGVLLAHGVGVGINTVLNFVPQLAMLFFFLSLLEDSGYMARAAFVMDRFMQAVGLPGKSFIPLIIGFGCNVPAIMATRTLENRRDRIVTALMTPFMSCGARLAIFVVFGAAFFPSHAGAAIFTLYVIGILIGLLTAWILQKTILRGEPAAFVMELPPYHKPDPWAILMMTGRRLRGFVVRAGKYILPICVLLAGFNAIHIKQQSLLAVAGKAVTPVLQPMGVNSDNWPAAVGLFTGTLAKEVVVGTLNTLYTQQQGRPDADDFSVIAGLRAAWAQTQQNWHQVLSWQRLNPVTANEGEHEMTRRAQSMMIWQFGSAAAAFSYLLFVLLYIPCVSTMAVMAREIGRGWAWLSTCWSLFIAYVAAVLCYQSWFVFMHPWQTLAWWLGIMLLMALLLLGLRLAIGEQQDYAVSS